MRGNPMLQKVKQMMSFAKMSRDPQAAIMSMMGNNPQMQQVMSLIQNNGGDAMQVFRQIAQQNGIDPQEILDMLK